METKPEKVIPDITISTKYIPVLAEFMADRDIRYYLNGIKVEPHHEKGVLLVATDGRALTVIHDLDGKTNGSFIIELPKSIVSACKKKNLNFFKSPKIFRVIDEGGYVMGDVEADPLKIGFSHLEVAHVKLIDGKFPNWRKVIPRKLEKSSLMEVNAQLLNKVSVACKGKDRGFSPITVFMNGRTGAIVIRVEAMPEMVAICMPMRIDDKEAIKQPIPDWLVLPELEKKAA